MKKKAIILIAAICITVFMFGAVSKLLPNSKNIKEQESLNDEGISVAEKIENIISSMTVEEKVGQMFFVRCPGKDAILDVNRYNLGGYVLFGRDFKDYTKEEVQTNISAYQHVSKVPLLIGVDEEGGTVVRVSSNKRLSDKPFLSPQEVFNSGGYNAVAEDTREKAELLKELGINMNLSPVCDVSVNENDFIYKRSFGKNAQETAEYVKTVVSVMRNESIASCLKHFPGYGSNVDTHSGSAYDVRPIESFRLSDFLPFTAGIAEEANSVLVSHNIIESMEPNMPASLSLAVHEILRDELAFDGVIMTDDLAMDAIGEYAKPGEAAVLAVLAGNDMILASEYSVQIPAVIAAVNAGRITTQRLDESVCRILKLKAEIGLLK